MTCKIAAIMCAAIMICKTSCAQFVADPVRKNYISAQVHSYFEDHFAAAIEYARSFGSRVEVFAAVELFAGNQPTYYQKKYAASIFSHSGYAAGLRFFPIKNKWSYFLSLNGHYSSIEPEFFYYGKFKMMELTFGNGIKGDLGRNYFFLSSLNFGQRFFGDSGISGDVTFQVWAGGGIAL